MKKTIALIFLVLIAYQAASRGAVKSDLYAYYARLDYTIPLSEICTEAPFARLDPDVEGRRWKEGTQITGKYADIVVHIDDSRRLVFGRETSYCPWLETPRGRFPLEQLVACQPDPMCLCSYVRIIKNEPEEVLIHWRHVPDPERIAITEQIHELFAVHRTAGWFAKLRWERSDLRIFRIRLTERFRRFN